MVDWILIFSNLKSHIHYNASPSYMDPEAVYFGVTMSYLITGSHFFARPFINHGLWIWGWHCIMIWSVATILKHPQTVHWLIVGVSNKTNEIILTYAQIISNRHSILQRANPHIETTVYDISERDSSNLAMENFAAEVFAVSAMILLLFLRLYSIGYF